MNKSNSKHRGSGILIVILSAITFSIYAASTYAQQQHFDVMEKKYETNIVNYYEKDNGNIDEIYNELFRINGVNKLNESNM